jgi:hypothetical protein
MTPLPLTVAFKEWAAICQSLASGRQCLILRKGGISEEGGKFLVEHSEFLLYPTYFHEHQSGMKPEYRNAFESAEEERPALGTIAFTHFVRVTDVQYVTQLETALALDPLHAWTADVIRQRFHYRTPGLFVLTVRVYRLPQPVIRPERPEYAGCKTWVTLDSPVSTEGVVPVLTDEEFEERTTRLQKILW